MSERLAEIERELGEIRRELGELRGLEPRDARAFVRLLQLLHRFHALWGEKRTLEGLVDGCGNHSC